MFDRAWLENELAGLIIQLHQTEGAISVIQQMIAQLDQAEASALQATTADPPILTEQDLLKVLPPGARILGVETHEDPIHP